MFQLNILGFSCFSGSKGNAGTRTGQDKTIGQLIAGPVFSGFLSSRKTGHSGYFQFVAELQIVLGARDLARSSDSGVPGSPTQWIVASSPATQDKQRAAHEPPWNRSFS